MFESCRVHHRINDLRQGLGLAAFVLSGSATNLRQCRCQYSDNTTIAPRFPWLVASCRKTERLFVLLARTGGSNQANRNLDNRELQIGGRNPVSGFLSFAVLLKLLPNPRIKLFSERLFVTSPFPVDDDSQRIRWLRADVDLRHTALDLIPPRVRLDNYDVAGSFEQIQ